MKQQNLLVNFFCKITIIEGIELTVEWTKQFEKIILNRIEKQPCLRRKSMNKLTSLKNSTLVD